MISHFDGSRPDRPERVPALFPHAGTRNVQPGLLVAIILAVTSGCKEQATIAPRVSDSQPLRTSSSSVDTVPVETLAIDRLNREVLFQSIPQRIISLTPAVTELMFALGAGPQLVGVTKNCNYPSEAESLMRVGGGTLESLSRETIVSLRPDLVLCKWDNHQPLMETLEQFKIPTLAIGSESMDELFTEATMLGQVTGHADEASRLIAEMKQRLEILTARVKLIPEEQQRKVFYEVWDDPLMTAGPGSFIGETLDLAGLKNIFFDATTKYPKVSDEVVVARNPDVILSPSTHASQVSIEKLLGRQGWSEVNAVKLKQVYIINGDHVSRCGPRLLDALEEIIKVVYPEYSVTSQPPREVSP